jgi:prepilin-type N-terminal cleavage/methylation domain-containing protein
MNKRTGFTLIEMIVVMTVGSVLTTLAMSLVHQMLSFSQEASEFRECDRAIDRLISDLRRDAHIAVSVSRTDDRTLRLTTPEDATVYAIEATAVTRTLTHDGGVAREVYRLAPHQACQWEVLADPVRIQVTIESSSAIANAPAIPLRRLLASLGRYRVENVSDEAAP